VATPKQSDDTIDITKQVDPVIVHTKTNIASTRTSSYEGECCAKNAEEEEQENSGRHGLGGRSVESCDRASNATGG
jgi:hypothetical protein